MFDLEWKEGKERKSEEYETCWMGSLEQRRLLVNPLFNQTVGSNVHESVLNLNVERE